MREHFSHFIDQIENWHIYVTLLLVLIITLLIDVELPVKPGRHAQHFYEEIEKLEENSTILMSIEYNVANRPELEPMAVAALQHAFSRNLKVILISLWAQGPEMAESALLKVFKNPSDPERSLVYGSDYVNLGYAPGGSAAISALDKGFAKVFPRDFYGNMAAELPLIAKIDKLEKIDLVVDFFAGSVNGVEPPVSYMMFGRKTGQVFPLITGSSAVLAAQHYPYVHSGDVKGFLAGIKGAADYEYLLGHKHTRHLALTYMPAQSMAHILLIILIILKNIQFVFRRRKK